MLVDELGKFSEDGRLNLNYIPYNAPEEWPLSKGVINKDMLHRQLPKPGSFFGLKKKGHRVLNLVCGTKAYKNNIENVLKEIGYSDEEIFLIN